MIKFRQRIGLLKRAIRFMRRNVISRFLSRLSKKLLSREGKKDDDAYDSWVARFEGLSDSRSARFPHAEFLLISVVVDLRRKPRKWAETTIASVVGQTYEKWELCVMVDDGRTGLRRTRSAWSIRDPRIRIMKTSDNIATDLNGQAVAFLEAGDKLAPSALLEIALVFGSKGPVDFVYSDEDEFAGKRRCRPQFKPDYSPDLLRSYNYIGHLVAVHQQLLRVVGWRPNGAGACPGYNFVLRATERSSGIVHIPRVLYHARQRQISGISSRDAIESVQRHLQRIGRKGTVTSGPFPGAVVVQYHIAVPPLVSIIIPNRNSENLLRNCIQSILGKTTYPNYEIIVMDNQSDTEEIEQYYNQLRDNPHIRVIKWPIRPFNYSRINNDGAQAARGELLLFLNNDTEVITHDWIGRMAEHLQFDENAAVGAKLRYLDGSIQHAGVIIGIGGNAGHAHRRFPGSARGYLGRLQVIQNYSAVTAACILVKRSVFMDFGGFDVEYPLALNDVDLCLRIRKAGHLIVWTPFAELFHDESSTRGEDVTEEKRERFRKEVERFHSKWASTLEAGDPYYNPNLSLTLENMSLRQ